MPSRRTPSRPLADHQAAVGALFGAGLLAQPVEGLEQWGVGSGLPDSINWAKPRMALSGERNSCLMAHGACWTKSPTWPGWLFQRLLWPLAARYCVPATPGPAFSARPAPACGRCCRCRSAGSRWRGAQGFGARQQLQPVGAVGRGAGVEHIGGGIARHALGTDIENLDHAVGVGGNAGDVGAGEDGVLQRTGFHQGGPALHIVRRAGGRGIGQVASGRQAGDVGAGAQADTADQVGRLARCPLQPQPEQRAACGRPVTQANTAGEAGPGPGRGLGAGPCRPAGPTSATAREPVLTRVPPRR